MVMFHVKQFALLLLLAGLAWGQEVKRPTMDVDGGGVATSLGCLTGSVLASAAMPLGYDAAGLTTASGQETDGPSSGTSHISSRIFQTWESPGVAYTSLTLNVNSASNGYLYFSTPQTGSACVGYSLNGGASWTNIRCDSTGAGWTQRTDTITLSASQDLSMLRVGVCTRGSPGVPKASLDPGADDVTVWDIWTAANTPPTPPSPPSPSGGGSSAGNAHRSGVIVF
jgi:hypothetical protein